MTANANLRTAAPNPSNASLLPVTGQVRYIVDHGRWDCLCPVGEVSSGGAQQPSDLHVATLARWLTTSSRPTIRLLRCRTTGTVCICRCLLRYSWKSCSAVVVYAFSKTAKNIAQSSTHAEVMAVDLVARLVEYSRQVCKFLHIPMTTPTRIFDDHKSAIELCETLKSTHITSSINMRRQYIRELINRREISLHFVPTKLMPLMFSLSHSLTPCTLFTLITYLIIWLLNLLPRVRLLRLQVKWLS